MWIFCHFSNIYLYFCHFWKMWIFLPLLKMWIFWNFRKMLVICHVWKICIFSEKSSTLGFFEKNIKSTKSKKSFDVATKRKLVTRRFKSQMRSYLKYNYQIINFNKPFAHGLRSCKNVPYHVNQISKNRKWIIFKFWVRFRNPLNFCKKS